MKLNIGSGDTQYEDYIRIDYDDTCNPDYRLNLETDKLPFEDSSVEVVLAHHILEHLGEGYFHCLKELYRVCKHGALIDIKVPHPRHESFLADPTHKRPITVLGLKLFSKKFNEYCKENQTPASRLGDYYDVDFEILDFKYVPDDRVFSNYSNLSIEELEEISQTYNNIISEICVKLMVIKNGK
jgi:ubiquinone/menaquinone biosynthesis C-methylase UbiE